MCPDMLHVGIYKENMNKSGAYIGPPVPPSNFYTELTR